MSRILLTLILGRDAVQYSSFCVVSLRLRQDKWDRVKID